MAGTHSAAGPAAGYHFQLQRALLDLLAADDDETAISIETLDDLVLSAGDAGSITDLEQLKHSVSPGSLTDASRPWWDAMAVWMDLAAADDLSGNERLVLVTTHDAPADSAAAHLRAGGDRRTDDAIALLEIAARESSNLDTQSARHRFLGESDDGLDEAGRRRLVERVQVVDGAASVGEFRSALRARLRVALPAHGVGTFLDQVVGAWERYAVDLLLRRHDAVSKATFLAEIARIRDGFTEGSLPSPDPSGELDEVVVGSYEQSAFVYQLRFIGMRDARVRLAIADYHRAFAQRARWLDDGVLGPGQLTIWETQLVDEWRHAFERMLDAVEAEKDSDEVARAGLILYDTLQQSDRAPLLGSTDFFLNRGAQHGLADVRRLGWHRDFRDRLEEVLGPVADRRVEDAYQAALRSSSDSA